MTTLREAAQQALEANHKKTLGSPFRCTACGGALPTTGRNDATGECVCGEPSAPGIVHRKDGPCYHAEPVAWMVYTEGGASAYVTDNPRDLIGAYRALPLYTAPPQRLPLTEEEILAAVGWERAEMYMKLATNFPVDEAKQETLKNARAIERAVWEKNHG